MAISYASASLGSFAAALATAAAGGTLRLRATTTTICDIPLESTAFDRSGAVLTARGEDGSNPIGEENPLEGETEASGTINNYQVLDSSDGVVWSNDSTTGLTLDTLTIAGAGRTIRLTGFTHTIGNAS